MARFRAGRARARAGRVREHLHERPRRAAFDHLARRSRSTTRPGEVESIVAAGLDVTEHRRQEEEIRASRGRIVAAGDEERRRLERNLHDGAQQRLVSLSLALRLAQVEARVRPGRRRRRSSPARARSSRWRSRSCASSHAASIRRCSPTAASTPRSRASRPARRSRSSSTRVGRRLPEPIEAAAYYVVSEAVANVVKHARRVRRSGSGVEAENGQRRDRGRRRRRRRRRRDGGSGLRGLADRVAALDGRLVGREPAGRRARGSSAEIPLPARLASE